MYFSYVPSIIFSFFNHPLFLNLLFKQILIQYYSIVSLVLRENTVAYVGGHLRPLPRGGAERAAGKRPRDHGRRPRAPRQRRAGGRA